MPEPSQARRLKFYEGMAADMLMDIAGRCGEHVQQKEILTALITLEVVADLKALEAKRKQLLAESEYIVKVSTSVLQDTMELPEPPARIRVAGSLPPPCSAVPLPWQCRSTIVPSPHLRGSEP
jgi:hypothetical protein